MKKVALLFLIMTGGANAQTITGNILLEACQERPGEFCSGFVAGVVNGIQVGAASAMFMSLVKNSSTSFTAEEVQGFCIPDNVTINQIRDIAVKYLMQNPENRHALAAPLVGEAVRKVFPCQ